jgi:circadian clock protein KaiC
MSVIKKRAGPHEDTIREFRIGRDGISLGEPLHEFQGILRGTPTYVGGALADKTNASLDQGR